jgi:plastocyanin
VSRTFSRARAAAALLPAAALLAAAARAGAQGAVRGQVAILERPGAEQRDLATAVVYLEIPGRVARDAGGDAPRSTEIVMRGREFLPHVRAVLAGGEVAFPNRDPFSHNVFSNAELGPFDLGLYRRGASRSARFDRPGVYPIYCNIHSRMVSFVVATPTPYVTQPDADGRFAIPRVPAGTYVLHVWHERGGEVAREVTVGATGAAGVRVELDGRSYVAGPHPNKFGRSYAATRADRY